MAKTAGLEMKPSEVPTVHEAITRRCRRHRRGIQVLPWPNGSPHRGSLHRTRRQPSRVFDMQQNGVRCDQVLFRRRTAASRPQNSMTSASPESSEQNSARLPGPRSAARPNTTERTRLAPRLRSAVHTASSDPPPDGISSFVQRPGLSPPLRSDDGQGHDAIWRAWLIISIFALCERQGVGRREGRRRW